MNSTSPADQERYRRAWDLLHDPQAQASVEQIITALDATSAPHLALVAGADRLVGAKRVGLLAGSFNPPTLAHVALAQAARAVGRLDVVIWTISRVTVNKERVTKASLPSRLITLAALTADLPHDAVGLVNRGLYAEQAVAARACLPAAREIACIVGFDKIVQIVDPQYYADRDAALAELFGQAEILVAPRATEGTEDLAAIFARPENRRWADRVAYIPLDPALRQASSSDLRERIARGEPIADAAPPEAVALADCGAYA